MVKLAPWSANGGNRSASTKTFLITLLGHCKGAIRDKAEPSPPPKKPSKGFLISFLQMTPNKGLRKKMMMHTEEKMNERRPLRRQAPRPLVSQLKANTLAALKHCDLSVTPGDEAFDCPLNALARRLITAEGDWVTNMLEDEALTVQAVFGLQIEWQGAKGARWTRFWMVPLPASGEIQKEVKAFEQFLASRPEPKAMRVAADSIRRVAELVSGYVADMATHGARPAPAPWNAPEPRPASEGHA